MSKSRQSPWRWVEMSHSRLGSLPIHPFLIASFPVLALAAHNVGQIQFADVPRSWATSLAVAGAALALMLRLYRSSGKAALAASVLTIGFFSYGQLYDGLKRIGLFDASVVRHRYLLPIVVAAVGVGLFGISRLRRVRQATASANLVAIALLLQPVLILMGNGGALLLAAQPTTDQESSCSLANSSELPLRDVYFIVMDAYARDDALRRFHRHDNSGFLGQLESLGFYVARGSLSNYAYTEPSMASVLNLDYVQNLFDADPASPSYRSNLVSLIRAPRMRRELECIGYKTVAIESGVFWTDWEDADFHLSKGGGAFQDLALLGRLTRFETMLVDSTVVRAPLDLAAIARGIEGTAILDPNAEHRDRILFALDQLPEIADLPSPKLVYVHILSPHPPMVFGPNGEFVSLAQFETDPEANAGGRLMLKAYADQVKYLNGRLLEMMGELLAAYEDPPIIVIQGDHGWADQVPEDRLAILNAYLLPDGGLTGLYPTITPVNTFRYIFDMYFGADFGLLPDVSYFSDREAKYDYWPVTNSWSPGQ